MRRNIGVSEGSSIYLLGLCAGSILANIMLTFSTGSNSALAWIALAINQIGFLIVVFLYCYFRKVEFVSVVPVKKSPNVKQWFLLPLISIATIILFLPITNLFVELLTVMGYSGTVGIPKATSIGLYFLSLFVIAILPAIGEEFLFRGPVFSSYLTKGVWWAILMSGFLFSIMHASPLQTVHQFGLGVVLAIVLLISRSIWACVFIHFFNNFVVITIDTFIPEIDALIVSLGDWIYLTNFASIIVGLFLVVTLLYLFFRSGEKKKDAYRLASDGVVYDDFTIYATVEDNKMIKKSKFENNVIVGTFKFIGSLFTKRGWSVVTRELEYKNPVPFLGKNQPMFGLWMALGFSLVYWLLNFITKLL